MTVVSGHPPLHYCRNPTSRSLKNNVGADDFRISMLKIRTMRKLLLFGEGKLLLFFCLMAYRPAHTRARLSLVKLPSRICRPQAQRMSPDIQISSNHQEDSYDWWFSQK